MSFPSFIRCGWAAERHGRGKRDIYYRSDRLSSTIGLISVRSEGFGEFVKKRGFMWIGLADGCECGGRGFTLKSHPLRSMSVCK